MSRGSPLPSTGSRRREDTLQLGPREKACTSDPLVSRGRHFGRTVYALCNIQTLLTNGILYLREPPEEPLTPERMREHRVFKALLQMIPDLETRLMDGSDDVVGAIAKMIQKGVSTARSDDTKSLKGVILDWIVPLGLPFHPPLARNNKADRGFHHERTGALLCPAGLDWSDSEIREKLRSGELVVSGDQWPIFLYDRFEYDPEDPWRGLFKSSILVSAYKHVFTSPSSVEKVAKATRSGNARIHGMKSVTPASIAYIATQARFALSSSPVFSRSDTVTDSEGFYNSVLQLLEEPDEQEEVQDLLMWWNRSIFPDYLSGLRHPAKSSALAKIREKRALRKAAAAQASITM